MSFWIQRISKLLSNLKTLNENDSLLIYELWMIIKTQVSPNEEILKRMKTSQSLLQDEQWMKSKRKSIKYDLILSMKLTQESTLKTSFKLKRRSF